MEQEPTECRRKPYKPWLSGHLMPKRLSRYYKMLETSKEHLNPQAFKKVQMIGLKVLYLAPLFKEEDWEGLTDILSSISENTKRDDLPILRKALQEKRERVAAFKQE